MVYIWLLACLLISLSICTSVAVNHHYSLSTGCFTCNDNGISGIRSHMIFLCHDEAKTSGQKVASKAITIVGHMPTLQVCFIAL